MWTRYKHRNFKSTNCSACNAGYFLVNGSFCGDTCNTIEYKNTTLNKCVPCSFECLTCSGGTSSECLTCNNGYFLNGTTCSSSCPVSMYGDPATRTCQPCDPKCSNCLDGTSLNCKACKQATFLWMTPSVVINAMRMSTKIQVWINAWFVVLNAILVVVVHQVIVSHASQDIS